MKKIVNLNNSKIMDKSILSKNIFYKVNDFLFVFNNVFIMSVLAFYCFNLLNIANVTLFVFIYFFLFLFIKNWFKIKKNYIKQSKNLESYFLNSARLIHFTYYYYVLYFSFVFLIFFFLYLFMIQFMLFNFLFIYYQNVYNLYILSFIIINFIALFMLYLITGKFIKFYLKFKKDLIKKPFLVFKRLFLLSFGFSLFKKVIGFLFFYFSVQIFCKHIYLVERLFNFVQFQKLSYFFENTLNYIKYFFSFHTLNSSSIDLNINLVNDTNFINYINIIYSDNISYKFLYFLLLFILYLGYGVVSSRNPVFSLFYLIGIYLLSSIILLLYNLEFLGLIYIIIYIGAIAVLFLFIIMMLKFEPVITFKKESINYFIFFKKLLIYLIIPLSLYPIFKKFLESNWLVNTINKSVYSDNIESFIGHLISSSNNSQKRDIMEIGLYFYTESAFIFILCGVNLLIALIGCIMLTLKKKAKIKNQSAYIQILRK